MNYTITRLPKSELEVNITMAFAEFEPQVTRAAARISDEVEIEGFRKGKAPYEVVAKRVGEHAIYERAADLAVRAAYPELFDRLIADKVFLPEVNPPIGKPEITVTKLAPGNEFEFKLKLSLMPLCALSDWRAIAAQVNKEKKEVTVTDEEVANALVWVRESRATSARKDAPALVGDEVEIDFEVRAGGVKIEGGESRNHPLILGKSKFLPGFDEALVGMREGEERSFTLKVPEDWHDTSFAGKALEVTAKMHEVKARIVPDLPDEFAKSMGVCADVAALEASAREGLLKEKKDKEAQHIRSRIIEEIAASATVEVPEVLIVAELEKMQDELKNGVLQMGMEWDNYLRHIKKTEEGLSGEWRGEAEKRVRVALALRQVAREEKIEPASEEVEARVNQYLAQFASADEAQKKIDPDRLRDYARGILRNEKVFEFLEKI
mgnify:FL=1